MAEEGPHDAERGAAEPPGMPTWVKGLGVALALLVLAVLLVMAISGGQHGPDMHG